jgi:ribosomal protein S21
MKYEPPPQTDDLWQPPPGTLASRMARRPVDVLKSSGATNARAVVKDGDVIAAYRAVKKQLEQEGTNKLIRRDSRLYVYRKPSVRRREKSARARARVAKTASKAALRELRRDPNGRLPMPAPRREVVAASLAETVGLLHQAAPPQLGQPHAQAADVNSDHVAGFL